LVAFFLVVFFLAFFFAFAIWHLIKRETEMDYAPAGVPTRSSSRTLTRRLTPGSSIVTP
jgi:hypothetical protein